MQAIRYGLFYSYKKTTDGCYEYQYDSFFGSKSEVMTAYSKVNKILKGHPLFVAPDVSFDGDKLIASYPFNRETRYLFGSLYCRKLQTKDECGATKTQRIVGNANRALSFSQKTSIAFRLCDAFAALNNSGIAVVNPLEECILYSVEDDLLLIDVITLLLPLSLTTQATEWDRRIEYYAVTKHLDMDNPREINNFFLSALVDKLLSGRSLLAKLKIADINNILNGWSSRLTLPDGFIDNFVNNYCRVFEIPPIITVKERVRGEWILKLPMTITVRKDVVNSFTEFLNPEDLKNVIHEKLCCCGQGYFKKYEDLMICTECGKEMIGAVTANGKTLPLVATLSSQSAGSTQYSASQFCLKNTEVSFRLLRGLDECGDFRCALLFAINDKAAYLDVVNKRWVEVTALNSTRKSKILYISDDFKDGQGNTYLNLKINDVAFNIQIYAT